MVISDFDLSPNASFALQSAISRKRGLVLVCGPAGAGKTSLVDAMLADLGHGRSQVRLGGLSSEEARLLPGDCVVDVGDIRSEEVAKIACELAQRALVIGVLRSGRSYRVVSRLTSMGVNEEDFRLAEPVVMTQYRCRRLCPRCRAPAAVEGDATGKLGSEANMMSLTLGFVYCASGCSQCRDGYVGYVSISEILTLISGPSEGIAFRCDASLLQNGLIKVLAGQTTLEELERVGVIGWDLSPHYATRPIDIER